MRETDGWTLLVIVGMTVITVVTRCFFFISEREWRLPGCSMCLGMNPDQLTPGERSASTSNRNFEGRQGKGGRTHLVPPLVAAATAVLGRLASPSDLPAFEKAEA